MPGRIQDQRIKVLSDAPLRDDRPYVLYWMEASQRTRFNHALEYGVDEANRLGVPLVVAFCLTSEFPGATARSLSFTLDGVGEIARDLGEREIRFHFMAGSPLPALSPLLRDAALVVTDRGYLHHQRAWRLRLSEESDCRVVEVESNVVVPIELVTRKREYAARTIRPRINVHLEDYLVQEFRSPPAAAPYRGHLSGGIDPYNADLRVAGKVDRSVAPVDSARGGMNRAAELLDLFATEKLDRFAEERNDPLAGVNSDLSPYLRHGQISPIDIMLHLRRSRTAEHAGLLTMQEELVIRRELSCNYAFYEPDYDRYSALPEWARATLDEHRDDEREYLYSYDEFDAAETEDPYWNSAMREMKETGRMRGYMRMYWGKKVIEWSRSPESAFETLIALNNRYFLDGGDPNSYANVAWIFGLHDRPWQERPIFGKVRYMNANGLRRKFDIGQYVERYGKSG